MDAYLTTILMGYTPRPSFLVLGIVYVTLPLLLVTSVSKCTQRPD